MRAELAKTEPNLAAAAAVADDAWPQGWALRHQVRDEWLKLYAAFSAEQKAVVGDLLQKRMDRMEAFRQKDAGAHARPGLSDRARSGALSIPASRRLAGRPLPRHPRPLGSRHRIHCGSADFPTDRFLVILGANGAFPSAVHSNNVIRLNFPWSVVVRVRSGFGLALPLAPRPRYYRASYLTMQNIH